VGAAVSLRFTIPARPDLGASSLQLARTRPGRFVGSGVNLSMDGTYAVTVDLQTGSGGIEIPLTVQTRAPPQRIVAAPQGPGLPTLYNLELPGGRSVQTYLDPGRQGFNEFHVTYLGGDGNEATLSTLTVDVTGPGARRAVPLPVRRLDAVGHFVADLPDAARGTYRFTVSAAPADRSPIHAIISIAVR